MKQKLIVLAGAADPNSARARGRYKLIVEEAQTRGYETPQVIAWTGQFSAGGNAMDLPSASSQLAKLLLSLETESITFDIIAFTWGASVYLNTLSQMEAPSHLRNTVLWGIDEYWRFSEYFLSEESTAAIERALRDAGTNLSSEFSRNQIPNEVLLRHYPHSNFIRIGFGETDSESPPAFSAYLESFVNKSNITYRVVPEVAHVVADYHPGYIDCLFGV